MKTINLILIASAVLLNVSCSNDNDSRKNSDSKETEKTEAAVEKSVTPTGEVVQITLQSDDNMKFDKNEITVKEGLTVRLTLKHIGKMPKSAMGHNFVLLKKNVDVSGFANAAANSKAPDYEIPNNLLPEVIAFTRMIGGGESVTIEFLTPARGTYNFICSFPGHYGMMKGLFIVE